MCKDWWQHILTALQSVSSSSRIFELADQSWSESATAFVQEQWNSFEHFVEQYIPYYTLLQGL